MLESNTLFNPFPGLRPFQADEDHLFFGRDGQSDELLRRLRINRFLAVIGTSGSGKSSLVRAGLLPALYGGFMVGAGSGWRVAVFRPGNDPIGNLAITLNDPQVFGSSNGDAVLQRTFTEATLRRSTLGLIDVVGQARMPSHENLLIVVDQFEEIFRFKRTANNELTEDEAAAFVKLLLEATRQTEVPIYVVITMRSDFLGDCAQFRDLPEAINDGQYLIPRMSRDQRREAITGPVAVGGGEITPRLVNRLLNDVGDNPDQLPILQHALMRTWDYRAQDHQDEEPIDLRHYEAIGGMTEALSQHADEAYNELPDERSRTITEKLFKCLTEKGPDNREIRRPIILQEICAVIEAEEKEVVPVIETFRCSGRTFLMPPCDVPLDAESLIDISHESLIRGWQRLKSWVDGEALSAGIYRRVAETAVLYKEGSAGLWRDPDLQVALGWRDKTKPNKFWAQRYNPNFESAIGFLDQSKATRDAKIAEKEKQRRRDLNRTRVTAIVLGMLLIVSASFLFFALQQRTEAGRQAETAKQQTLLAEQKKREAEEALESAKQNQQEAEQARELALEAKRLASLDAERAGRAERAASESARRAEELRLVAVNQKQIAEDNLRRAIAAEGNMRRETLRVRKQNVDFNTWMYQLADRAIQLSTPNEDAFWHTTKARALTQVGNHQGAIEEFDAALKIDPQYPNALLGRSYVYLTTGQAEESVADTTNFLQTYPKYSLAHLNRAVALGLLKKYKDAEASVSEAIRSFVYKGYGAVSATSISPKITKVTNHKVLVANSRAFHTALYYQIANLRAFAGESFDQALSEADKQEGSRDAYLTALNWIWLHQQHQKIKDQDYGALVSEGALWERAGYKDEAASSYKEFQLRHKEHSDKRYHNLAKWVAQRITDPQSPALVINPPPENVDAWALTLDAMESLMRGEPDALKELNEAITKSNYKNIDYLIQRAQYRYYYMGDAAGARDDCNLILKLDRSTAIAYLLRALANLSANLGMTRDDVRRDILKAKELDPTILQINDIDLKTLSDLLAEKDPNEALDLLEKSAKVNLPSAAPYYLMAKLQNKKQNHIKALEKIKIAIAIKSDDLDFYNERATAERGINKQREMHKSEIDVLRNQVAGYNHAGDTLLRHNQRGLALNAYTRSLDLVNKNTEANSIAELQGDTSAVMFKLSGLLAEQKSKASAIDYWKFAIQSGRLKNLEKLMHNEISRLANSN